MSEKCITAEEVEIISEVKTLYRGKNDTKHWYLNERDARINAANANRCKTPGCNNYSRHFFDRCDECRARIHKEEHQKALNAAPEWDGDYPVCLGEDFFCDESEFVEHLAVHCIDPDSILELHACTSILAKDTISKNELIEQVEDQMHEDAECPAQVEEMIDQFLANLATISEPIAWIANRLVRVTKDQRNKLRKELLDA